MVNHNFFTSEEYTVFLITK